LDSSIELAVGDVLGRLERTNLARDSALNAGRLTVRFCANSIRELHRGEIDGARDQLASARSLLNEIRERTKTEPAIYWAGYVQDSMKEFAEASVLLAIISEAPLPSPTEIDVEDAPYLNGLCEAASELRRLVLHTLRGDDLDLAGRYLAAMNDIYDLLITVDFPDAITGGLRRSTDQLRAVLERTRGDFTLTLNQRRLENAIRSYQADLERSQPPDASS
jgi:translin